MVTESRQLQSNMKNQGHALTAKDAKDAEEKQKRGKELRVKSKAAVHHPLLPNSALVDCSPIRVLTLAWFFALVLPLRPWRPLR
jgi:hypothetical protein